MNVSIACKTAAAAATVRRRSASAERAIPRLRERFRAEGLPSAAFFRERQSLWSAEARPAERRFF